jgi:acyl-[acyl-carrier-protein]-phospholipid O-acyltransferase/long-chain-fatty-acid--[acyl-carrier-protein] ligase
MVPAEVLVVGKIPLLGSGKPDYVAALALAKESIAARAAAASSSAEKRALDPAV